MSETLVQEISSVVKELEGFINLKTEGTSQLLREAQKTADDLLRDFQRELSKRDEELIKLRRENTNLKKELEEAQQMSKTVSSLNEKIEKMRVQLEESVKERDKAREELNKIQELWKRFTSGE
ncbi:MAG: hypothetical protein N2738_09505 [Thermodesulfovibrionales bacterium]|nr:hypothetical protein [Thermodesulfovibrionales bacterium]